MELVITVDRSDDGLFVRAKGEVDLGTVAQLDSALDAACHEVSPPMAVVADLSGVTFLASSGLSALVRAHERCTAAGTPLRVLVGNRAVLRGFEVTGLDKVLDLRESE
ncbi:anti-sigma B factor antagonist [Prauserella isguenensis]|uniref:Anti-sigma factor antagonist n=1 Tax=Prauserella isguenensis TaxID=1470180 RepID=A0A839RYP2_9PSEU|nr:STAS domain-containing protein [Prauserella isguenensis]MBB3050891.1 anti-sigma B factor antagonist [Prauserella isguenensis]